MKRSYQECVTCGVQIEAGAASRWFACAFCSEFGVDGDGLQADPVLEVTLANDRYVQKRGGFLEVRL